MSNTKNFFDEIERLVPERNKHQIIEARVNNAIVSCINIMELITESFTEEEADDLNNRILLSIKTRNPEKFNRKIKKLKENEERK